MCKQYNNVVLYRVKWVILNGTKYNLSSVLIIGHEDDLPLFGKVTEIIVTVSGEIVFQVNEMYTASYDNHYHAYIVTPLPHTKTIPFQKILSFHPLTLNILNHINYIVLKNHIVIPYVF